ncbi:MAG: GIN domain-containing protein [Sphingobacteriales bacterium]
MKTSIVTIAITLASVFGISQSSLAAATSTEEATTLAEVTKINKIEIHGNVELFVSDASNDQVKVYNKYYTNNAMVQDQDGVLRISSYATQKLVVWVKVSDLSKISAYDNAEVKSFGKLSAIQLDVKLYNNAKAQLDLDSYSATISLNDYAKADLTGTVTTGIIRYDKSSYLNITNLSAANVAKKVNFDLSTIKCELELAAL